MNSKKVLKLLEEKEMIIKKVDHEPLMNMEEAKEINKNNDVAKNLFLVDEKDNYYLFSIKANRRLSLKTLALQLGVKELKLAKEDKMEKLLGISSGSLTPLALLNDKKHIIKGYIDYSFKNKIIGIHPLINTCTVWMKNDDLIDLLKDNKEIINYINLEKIL